MGSSSNHKGNSSSNGNGSGINNNGSNINNINNNTSSSSSSANSTIASTGTSATSPDARSCPPPPPPLFSHLTFSSPRSTSPTSLPISVNITANPHTMTSTADITSPIGTKPSTGAQATTTATATTSSSSSLAHPFPAPASLSVSTWNSLANSSLAAKNPTSHLSDAAPGFPDRRTSDPSPSILVRKLPVSMSADALKCVLLFAADLVDVNFITYPDDLGYQAAIAQFGSVAGAVAACQQLNGKTILNQDVSLIVEIIPQSTHSNTGSGGTTTPAVPGSTAPQTSIGTGRHSRFFHGASGHGHASSVHLNTSVPANSTVNQSAAPSGPNGITAGSWLLNTSTSLGNVLSHPASAIDPPTHSIFTASANQTDSASNRFSDIMSHSGAVTSFSGFPTSLSAIPREDKNGMKPPTHLGPPVSLSQNAQSAPILADPITIRSLQAAAMSSPPNPAASARNVMHPTPLTMPNNMLPQGAPASAITPATNSGAMWFSTPQQTPTVTQFPRHSLPPINPADQNPPCNTLYVGNLPLDTSEDELKAMFSKQRGFKRLCFRVKHNGPMCFVEFEDVSFATKALNDLYGFPLHNSVKGGIRLSFSKNPLGVRSGQNPANGMAHGVHTRLSTVSGPPPGLPAPNFYSVAPAAKAPGCTTANACFPYSADVSGRSFELAPWNQPVAYSSQYNSRPMGR